MVVESTHSARTYMYHMRDAMGSLLEIGHERFTGYFLGRLFCVSYNSGYEWNRRITSQKNTALGFVRKNGDGCRVHYIHFKGMLSPPTFLTCCVLLTLMALYKLSSSLSGQPLIWLSLAMGFGVTAITAPIETLIESFTEKSQEGADVLKAFLLDPSDPFSYLNHGG